MVSGAGFGPTRIPPSEYVAWSTLTGRILAEWEFEAMRLIDTMFVAERLKDTGDG